MAYYYSNTLPLFAIFSEIVNDETSYCGAKNWPSIALSFVKPEAFTSA